MMRTTWTLLKMLADSPGPPMLITQRQRSPKFYCDRDICQ